MLSFTCKTQNVVHFIESENILVNILKVWKNRYGLSFEKLLLGNKS